MTAPQVRTPGGNPASADTSTSKRIVPDECADVQAEYWSARIRAAHATSVEAIINTGHELLAAKAALPHGEWGRLTGETTREPLLPFSSQTTQRLMQIAENPVLSNPAHWAGFPASWRTLAELARLPVDVLERYVVGGVIHPEVTRATVEDLLEKLRIERQQADPPPRPETPDSDAQGREDAMRKAAREAQAAQAARERAEAAQKAAHRQRRREKQRAQESAFSGSGMGTWLISREDFRLVLGCLHPDPQPPERQDKYTKAFQIFKALERRIVAGLAA